MKHAETIMAMINQLEQEATATRKCLQHIPADKFSFKPHPTSMEMGYLAKLVAEIPLWIYGMVTDGEIDLATYRHAEINTTEELVAHFDDNMTRTKACLQNATEMQLERLFYLKSNGKELFSVKTLDYIPPTINHWIHHRGQLTVYMRICEIKVPSIYGPSGDDNNYVQ